MQEFEGKTVPEAVDSALKALGARRDDVDVEILQEPSGGFLGLGSKPAKVRVFPKNGAARAARADRSAAPAAAADTKKACAETDVLVKDLLSLMGYSCSAAPASWDAVQERVRCSVEGADCDRLLAQDGRVLEAFQFLVTLIVSRKAGGPVAVQVDARGYWDKKEKDILALAEKGVAEARATGKAYRLQPMEPALRRLIHRSLMNHPEVETASEGEGAWRKIVIRPRKR
jgi:spoIIIJ-associated protein